MRKKGKGYDCPETGFKERCNDGRNGACPHWVLVRGEHPQTGEDQDMWDCSHRWVPILLVDLIRRTNSTGAAVEGLRNETQRGNQDVAQRLAGAMLRLKPLMELNAGHPMPKIPLNGG